MTGQVRHLVGLAVIATLVFAFGLASAARADESVTSCGPYPNGVFQFSSAYGIEATATCPSRAIELNATALYSQGQGAIWQATAPAGLEITGAAIPPGGLKAIGVNAGKYGQYGGDFYWSGGSSPISFTEAGVWLGPMASNYFGFLLVCGRPTCTELAGLGIISATEIVLGVRETIGPSMSASGLWQASGWVRGTWPLGFSGDSPSGLCSMSASLNGQPLSGSSSEQSPWLWHQCNAPTASDSVVTQGYGQGPLKLVLGASDAAGNTAAYSKMVYVDNQTPTISLSGPSDASSTAGVQYVTASASAGPSGVYGIWCRVDGGTASFFKGATAQVPVSGVGQHQVRCFSANNARAANGSLASSSVASFGMKIGIPTVTAIAFSKLVDRLRCHRTRRRVRVPQRWVRVHGHRVERRAHVKTEVVRMCHPRTRLERRSVMVRVRRHGRFARVRRVRLVRVLLLPHVVDQTSRLVRHGTATTVGGWLGTSAGTALAGQPIVVLAAVDDGQDVFAPVASATTDAFGSWTASLPAGPSRLVEAEYAGGADTQASVSSAVTEVVPAKVALLKVSPRRVAWGGTVHITGRLEGGYLPAGGALVRLRIGLGAAHTTYGVHEHVSGDGRFTTSYTFGLGDLGALRRFWFQLASLPMGDYPYAPANSRRRYVLVGGSPGAIR